MEMLLGVNVFARLHARCGGRSLVSLVGKKAPSAQEFFLKAPIDFRREEKWAVAAERRPQDSCSWATPIISFPREPSTSVPGREPSFPDAAAGTPEAQ